MFRNISRRQKQLKLMPFSPHNLFSRAIYQSLQLCLIFLTVGLYYNTFECFPFFAKLHIFLFIYVALTRSPQLEQLTNANYCSNHVTQWDTTIKYIIAYLG